jgi:hypothetical protein
MAFKLAKGEETRLDDLKKEIGALYVDIEVAVNEYNEREKELREPIETAVNAYNEKLALFRSFVEEVAAERRNEFEEKSETWQDGDNGQAADEWINNWENADLEDVAIKFPEEELEVDFESHADIDLPVEP